MPVVNYLSTPIVSWLLLFVLNFQSLYFFFLKSYQLFNIIALNLLLQEQFFHLSDLILQILYFYCLSAESFRLISPRSFEKSYRLLFLRD